MGTCLDIKSIKKSILKNLIKTKSIREISELYNCHEVTIYNKCRKYKLALPKREFNLICKVCSKNFTGRTEKTICCSNKCRYNLFRKKNPGAVKRHSRKWRLKQKTYCNFCSFPIPAEKRLTGVHFCSDNCRRDAKLKSAKVMREKAGKLFSEYKCSLGCFICGYNKFGGSIDFHHVNPLTKDMRITLLDFYYKDKRWEERKKCILSCKNCHYELHDLIKHNIMKYQEIIENIPQEKIMKLHGELNVLRP